MSKCILCDVEPALDLAPLGEGVAFCAEHNTFAQGIVMSAVRSIEWAAIRKLIDDSMASPVDTINAIRIETRVLAVSMPLEPEEPASPYREKN